MRGHNYITSVAGLIYQKLYFMHKVNNGMVPTYIADLIPPLVSEISGTPSEIIIFEPVHEIFNNVVCATSRASDQPAYARSLI